MKEESLVVTLTPLYDTELDLHAAMEEVVKGLQKNYPGVNIDARVVNGAMSPNQTH